MTIGNIDKIKGLFYVCVVILEREWCKIYTGSLTDNGEIKEYDLKLEWTPLQYIEEDATRLFEEITRRIKSLKCTFDAIIVSMPGTIKNNEIFSSSRLGIKKSFPAGQYLSERLNTYVRIIHDINCMLFGSFTSLSDIKANFTETICYIVVDEGVGAAIMIDGKIRQGAGVAGHISRLVVEENGIFHQELSAIGTLESYVSRPWISQHCVHRFESARMKNGLNQSDDKGQFLKALQAASKNNKNELGYEHFVWGISEKNKIVIDCFKVAAGYLGRAINAIITITHPHKIILSGNMISKIPDFYENTIEAAGNLSWPNAWNNVTFQKRDDSRFDQIKGSFMLSIYR